MNQTQNNIIKILKDDARTTPSKIAVMLNLAEAEIKKQIDFLEKTGVIVKYSAVVNDEKLEKDSVQALIEVKVSPMRNMGFDSIAEDIYQFEEVKSVYLMSGAYDLAVFIEGDSLKKVANFVSEKLSVLDKVISTATHFILKKYKQDGVILESDSSKRQAVQP